MKNLAVIAATCLMVATPASAATSDGKFASYGLGATSCLSMNTAYKSDKSGNTSANLSSWVAGYLSDFNRDERDVFDATPVTDIRALTALLLNLCERNVALPVEAVLRSAVENFKPLKIVRESAIIEWANGNSKARIREETVAKIQQHLVKNGLLQEKFSNGRIGKETIAALSNWQKARSVSQSGVPDIVTLFKISSEMSQAK
jgi:hypothetical protein